MNPRIPADYHETGAWLAGFGRSHAKRVSPHVEALVDSEGPREGRSYGLRLAVGARTSPPIELDFREVADGRPRFAWCAALGERIEAAARELIGAARSAG